MILESFPDAIPFHGLIGGLMIGLAAAVLLLGAGQIAGISGLFARASTLSKSGPPWVLAFAFILSMLAGALIISWINEGVTAIYPSSTILLVVGGLLVGFGTRLGSGCTSGHGVCGMSRFSIRSLVATPVFIGAGIATVALMRAMGVTP
ncbi:MAG: YeeE/YedE thiosulfate transporter family protein [Parasphingorhabdus sp.]